ncbi:MAG: DUF3305 domain-containing protein [Rhodospirillaceae bacterium]|jgi:hypothetical protein|nr:DUF3305 domain-containing protein [Rhodospirillaceae bacterium]MBT5561539.1 DUF3305 domain-containing protein [Rhodospirillaceae bacterium]MBT6241863.1 DUF3305 domain-containing protein [Rhodospirillaceae bacterium]MBT7138664.1 DUF3305 domain-containing protein [Rhodospirillaceae bacterium]
MTDQPPAQKADDIPRTMDIGVVLERRDIDNRWADHEWKLVGVIPGGVDMEDWQVLREGDGWTHFFAGMMQLELFPRETEGYKVNLSQSPPQVFVVLRPEEEGAHEHEVTAFEATLCPFEAEGYDESGDEWVEGVQMPEIIHGWAQAFVERHHVDVPFKKRKRKAYDPRKARGERRPPGRQNG